MNLRQSEIKDKISIVRNPKRISPLEVVNSIFTNIKEIPNLTTDYTISSFTAELDGEKYVIISTERGKNIQEGIKSNFGAIKTSGFEKVLETIYFAEKNKLPIISFINIPGADASVEAEENGQSALISQTMLEMGQFDNLNISVFVGEGHSGGALAIANTSVIVMFENALFNVASPEAVNAVLKKSDSSSEKFIDMPSTAEDLKNYGLVDIIIDEKNSKEEQFEQLKTEINKFKREIKGNFVNKRAKKFQKFINNRYNNNI